MRPKEYLAVTCAAAAGFGVSYPALEHVSKPDNPQAEACAKRLHEEPVYQEFLPTDCYDFRVEFPVIAGSSEIIYILPSAQEFKDKNPPTPSQVKDNRIEMAGRSALIGFALAAGLASVISLRHRKNNP